MFSISVRADFQAAARGLNALEKKQLPFATATALTSLAKLAQAAEKKALPQIFDRPTPFTINSIGVKGARKASLVAIVFVKDIAAAYLAPFEFGGPHKLIGSGRTWLNPKNMALLNQYGNFDKSALKRLAAKPDVFIGSVTFRKSGQTVSGLWQRPQVGQRTWVRGRNRRTYGTKGNTQNVVGGIRTGLRLLVRFGDAQPVRQHLDFGARAEAVVKANVNAEFAKALARAIATAKRK
ncbi:MAG: hypothetical protein EPN57_20565 [Paraburkholderia sp.]|nr:MAG: hypothetical protein EPN57_20565 [Paraburkholderia sp.]